MTNILTTQVTEYLTTQLGRSPTDDEVINALTNPFIISQVHNTTNAVQAILSIGPNDDVQEAIDDIASDGGGTVYLNPGTYTLADDLTIPSGVSLVGASGLTTILDFDGNAKSIVIEGSDPYDTGTITVDNGDTTITGSSTMWDGVVTPGQSILISGIWYPITAVNTDTELEIAFPFATTDVAGESYVIATIVSEVTLNNLTVQNSTGAPAISVRYTTEVDIINVATQLCDIGFKLYDSNQASIINSDSSFNGIGYDLKNTHFFVLRDTGAVSSTTNGLQMDGCTNAAPDALFFFNSGGNGIQLTNCSNSSFMGVLSSNNGDNGWEFVSGNTALKLSGCGALSNVNDGFSLTATSDEIGIVNAAISNNGVYGLNIAAATCDNNLILGNTFSGNGTAAANSGTGTLIRSNIGLADN